MENRPRWIKDSGALVVTVPQSKSLEFNDVHLFDSLHDSLANQKWPVVMEYINELQDGPERHRLISVQVTPAREIFEIVIVKLRVWSRKIGDLLCYLIAREGRYFCATIFRTHIWYN